MYLCMQCISVCIYLFMYKHAYSCMMCMCMWMWTCVKIDVHTSVKIDVDRWYAHLDASIHIRHMHLQQMHLQQILTCRIEDKQQLRSGVLAMCTRRPPMPKPSATYRHKPIPHTNTDIHSITDLVEILNLDDTRVDRVITVAAMVARGHDQTIGRLFIMTIADCLFTLAY